MAESGGRTFLSLLAIQPQQRSDADVDEIGQELKQLLAFQKFSKPDIDDFANVVIAEEVLAGETVFKQGDTGSEYYVIYRGSVDVAVSKTGDPADSEIVCALTEGVGFGDVAILKGTPRNATITTKENCIFLKIRGSTFSRVHARMTSGTIIPEEESSSSVDDLSLASSITEDDLSKNDEEIVSTPRGLEYLNDPLREALETEPEKRTQEELMDILEEMNHLKAFSHLSTSIRRELAAVVTFESFKKEGDVLFRQGDVGTSWYVIYRGSVEVIVNNVSVVTLGEGEGFGELALINDKPRAATILTKQEDCQFIKVDKKDYNRILKDIESNTIRLEEHGKNVMVMEKKVVDAETQGYVVMSATPAKLVQHLEEDHLADSSFMIDFLMTYRTFMTPLELWKLLFERFNHVPDGSADIQKHTRSKIANVVRMWTLNHFSDFENHEVSHQGARFLDALVEAKMEYEHDLLLSTMEARGINVEGRTKKREFVKADEKKSKVVQGPDKSTMSKRRNSVKQILAKSFARLHMRTDANREIADEPSPLPSPTVVNTTGPVIDVIRVNRDDDTFKTMKIEGNMTAKELVAQTLQKFHSVQSGKAAENPDDFVLVEVKSDGAIREFEPDETSLIGKLSLNGRFFLKPADKTKPFNPPKFEIPPVDANYSPLFLEMDADEVGRLLTILDHELMSRIDPLEYIAHIYKMKNVNTSNLNMFSNRFNQMNYWVVTEIVKTKNFNKRVALVKKFIKLAQVCRSLNNFNSCFAILSGLGNTAVSRLNQTWRRVPQKYVQEFEELQNLMDPSRNMKTYRQLLLNCSPPLIPFFPIAIKDLFFVHECNDSKINGLINFDKLRLISNIIRFIDAFRYSRYESIAQQPIGTIKKRRSTIDPISDGVVERAHSVQKITDFLNSLQVIDDMKTLSNMSREAEKVTTRHARAISFVK